MRMKKLLIVDDDAMVRQLVRMSLPTYQCSEAPDGETALLMVEQEQPDVIFLDWTLPGMSGTNVVKALQRYPEHRVIPIIMASARGEEQTARVARDLGLAGYLAKPFDVNELRAAVAKALEGK